MCRQNRHVKRLKAHFKSLGPTRVMRVFGWVGLLALLPVSALFVFRHAAVRAESIPRVDAGEAVIAVPRDGATSQDRAWRDSLGDGFPDAARLDSAQDRENFVRWLTWLAETQYYAPSSQAKTDVRDCAALIRFAFRNALVAHTPAWRQDAALLFDPGFGDITKFHYPYGPLGRALFRTRPGPVSPRDLEQGAFAEFVDSATLLRFNTFPISRDLRATRPGDLLFFHQPVQREPFHTMLFVGKSSFQPQGSDWIVYHTGDLNGRRGEIREVQAQTLLEHPDLHWRPLASNPNFLGVYRLEILR